MQISVHCVERPLREKPRGAGASDKQNKTKNIKNIYEKNKLRVSLYTEIHTCIKRIKTWKLKTFVFMARNASLSNLMIASYISLNDHLIPFV